MFNSWSRYYYVLFNFICFFFFKQKTAYEMRISDWSSDVCSSDLVLMNLDAATTLPLSPSARSIADWLLHEARELADSRTVVSEFGKRQIGRASCRERVCQYV